MEKEKFNNYVRQLWNARHSDDIAKILKDYEKALSLFAVSGQLPPSDCSKCGRSAYSKGRPFCTDEFCNGGNFH